MNTARKTLDLKGTPCPLNYVKAKLALEKMASGSLLEILVDNGEPIKNVPPSLKEDGHEILLIQEGETAATVTVRKK